MTPINERSKDHSTFLKKSNKNSTKKMHHYNSRSPYNFTSENNNYNIMNEKSNLFQNSSFINKSVNF
jgi:hypothetical protein